MTDLVFEADNNAGEGVVFVLSATGGAKAIKFRGQATNGFVETEDELGDSVDVTNDDGADNFGTDLPFVDGPQILSFNGNVYLQGADNAGDTGLFFYNSKTGAADELAGKSGRDTLLPTDFTAYDGEVYFAANTDLGQLGGLDFTLWVTNGTAAGTHEVAKSPFDDGSMTVNNGLLLFNGIGANHANDLLAFNAKTGRFSEAAGAIDPTDMRAIAVKNGASASNEVFMNEHLNLQSGHARSYLAAYDDGKVSTITIGAKFGGLDPFDFAGGAWGTKSEAFFSGVDSSNQRRGLWESSGTSAGTKEVVRSSWGGAEAGLDPYDITSFKGQVYFAGNDTPGSSGEFDRGLFVYNPATSKTTELIKSGTLNLSAGFDDNRGDQNATTLSVYDGHLVFAALNPKAFGAASVTQLYEYSGSGPAPTHFINVSSWESGSSPSGFVTT